MQRFGEFGRIGGVEGYALYEINIRVHIKPGLGKHPIKRLSVPMVQAFLNAKLQAGQSVRNVHILRQILSAALARADANGIRRIRVHAIRHTTASLLKDLKVPARDAQIILGHAHFVTTQQIYTHVDQIAQREAITKLNRLLGGSQ